MGCHKGHSNSGKHTELKLSLEHVSEGDTLTCSYLRTAVISLVEDTWSNVSACGEKNAMCLVHGKT